MFLGAITVSYNLPGVQTGLKLDGKTIADIFLGKIKTWNDAEIKALNPGVSLPSTAITVIHRSDSSGTTAGFTGFLAAVDPEWKSKVGEGKDVQWPTGTGAKGNAGVAGAVAADGRRRRLRRAGLRAAAQLHLRGGQEQGRQLRRADARLDERGGAKASKCRRTSASRSSTRAGASAYPITSQTFIVVNKDLCKAGTPGRRSGRQGRRQVPRTTASAQGQSVLAQADYAALPAAILAKSKEAVAGAAVQRLARSAG